MKINENIGQIMHGLSEQGIIEDESQIYQNIVKFPRISLMKGATLLLVNRVKSFKVENNKVLIQTEGIYVDEKYTYRYFDHRQVFVPKNNTTNIAVEIEFIDPRIVRIKAIEGFQVPEHITPMIENMVKEPVKLVLNETPDRIEIDNGTILVSIRKNPWNISISENGTCFYRQFGRDDRSFMPYEVCPFGFLYDNEANEKYACEAVAADPYEHFYGLGENYTAIDRKGKAFDLWNTNALGVNTDRAYKYIPYYISSKGYGVFLNTSRKSHCDMGQTLSKANSFMIEGDIIDMFIMKENSLKKLLPLYYKLTGQPGLPPKWSFGLWISKISYGTQKEVETVTRRMREMDIPCDVVHIDTDWFAENWVCDWRFDQAKFPDAEQMLKKLHEDGFKISLWQLPYVERGNISHEVYDEGMRKGYFASCENGSMKFPHGLIDFSNPEAVTWYKNELIKPLLRMGIDVIKVDFGESAAPFFKYANVDGKDMHNLYPLLYNKAAYEAAVEELGKDNAIIWARSAWAGSQQYPVHWGGDAGTDFGSMASSIKGCLSMGISGFPFWSSDLGGFWYSTSPQLYIRWTQYGMFCSHARWHGFYTREPWDFGEEACDIVRKYVKLRYALMPYIYSQAVYSVKNSVPMCRAMILEFPEDESTAGIDTQYMFGDSILVAPVLNEEDLVKVYLPKGIWTDYHTDEQLQGGQWLELKAELDIIPLYIKENAIIPMGPSMNYVDEYKTEHYTLHIYPVAGRNQFVIEEDGIEITMQANEEEIDITISPCSLDFTVVLHNINSVQVIVNDNSWAAKNEKNNTVFEVSGKDSMKGIVSRIKR